MNWQVVMMYWVAIVCILMGLSGLVPNFNLQSEIKKVSGSNGDLIFKIFFVLTLIAGAFVFRDTWQGTYGGGGGGGGASYGGGYGG